MANELKCEAFLGQNFAELKKELLNKRKQGWNVLFEDRLFPASGISINKLKPDTACKWRRPKEINPKAEFIVDGTSLEDLCQGELGDCWFLSSVACAATQPELIKLIVPEGQSFLKDYCGICHFRFWRLGKWYDVVIDDRLPVGEKDGKLFFMYCSNKKVGCEHEFWCALIEKAYAKFYGCYEFIKGGRIAGLFLKIKKNLL